MPKVHIFSLKRGTSHGLWQYKVSGIHERVMMHGVRQILDKTCRLLGYGITDRSAIYLLHLSDEPFKGYQVCLEKIRVAADGGCYYKVIQSNIGCPQGKRSLPRLRRHRLPSQLA